MLITKEQQEAWVDAYVKAAHTLDECVGFIDGINKALDAVKNNAVVSDMDIETAAVNAYKGKGLNEQRENIDKILAFEKGAKWALSKLSNNGS